MFEANQLQSALGEAGIANNEVSGRPKRQSVEICFSDPVGEGVGDIGNIVRMTLSGNVTITRGASHPGQEFPPDGVRRELMSLHDVDGTLIQDEAGASHPYDYVVIHDRDHYSLYAESAERIHSSPTVLNYEDCTNWVAWRTHLDAYSPLIDLIVETQKEKGNNLAPIPK